MAAWLLILQMPSSCCKTREKVAHVVITCRVYELVCLHQAICASIAGASTGRNPFEGYVPEVPDGERMDFGSASFVENERQGA